ncbi:AAA family ATPase [Curtobacterium sp. NPDC089991]|uniref:AAA family ATPase n=1 Tax=Curtobacterium sp. NPDC089991 TaxID=3363969 RepID=UPI003809B504
MATIALISGAPGSGKTTLASVLAAELGWPRVDRDQLYAGLMAGADLGRDEVVPHGVRMFWTVTAHLAAAGCSVIADATLYRGQSEADVRTALVSVGDVRNVHCRSALAFDRFVARGHPQELNDRVARNAPVVTEPLDLGVSRLDVDTTDGYDPELLRVVDWLRAPS